MSELNEQELDTGNRKALWILAAAGILMASSAWAATQIMGYLAQQEIRAITQEKDEHLAEVEKNLGLEIRALESRIREGELRVDVLEGEFVFGGEIATGANYSPKEKYLRKYYNEERERVIRMRTLPLLIAQIDKLRIRYEGSKYQKKKIPDLPKSKIMARWFYEAGKEVNINPMILISVAWVESRFRPDVCHGLHHSKAGAVGCMQIMPLHVARFDFIHDAKLLATDLETNIRAGAHILREYLGHRYAGEAENQLMAALRLYNYGPKNYGHRMRKKAKFNSYAEDVIQKAETIFDAIDPLREKFDPANDPAKYLMTPLAMQEIPLGGELY